MKTLLNILILLIQAVGLVLIGVGLRLIWAPLAWIYSGAAAFIFGHLLYRTTESEESDK